MASFNTNHHICGCWYASQGPHNVQRSYLPLHSIRTHTIIHNVTSRTTLTQSFRNDTGNPLKNIAYSFPLYDGVSVVSFDASIGSIKVHGIVKEKQQARQDYKEAIDKGSSAALFEQLPESSDIFTTSVGNVPAGESVIIELVYIGELKYDTETSGTRFTIPASIAPRYGNTPHDLSGVAQLSGPLDAIDIIVDIQGPEGCQVQSILSPSHHINVSIGRTTTMSADTFLPHCASATLSLNANILDTDFIITANVKDADKPRAFLETHPSYPGQRALMATLVPKFNLPPTYGEIVFIVDRSGSMGGKMDMVINAMTILLKSLPVGVKFNICSFGSRHSFLWPKSQSYTNASLSEALRHVGTFDANFGGTEIYPPIQSTISQNYVGLTLDVIILTDGETWDQDSIFNLIKTAALEKKSRFFSLGIGTGASTALVEGIAAAGNGISQFVTANEKMDKKMVGLLKAALTPRINDVKFEVKYKEDDFEMVDLSDTVSLTATLPPETQGEELAPKATMSFYNEGLDLGSDDNHDANSKKTENKFAHLPEVSVPSILQAPSQLSSIYSFSRMTVYLLLGSETRAKEPTAVVLRASSRQGPIELEIKAEDLGVGETIHQLAAKKAVHELEKGRGWLTTARDPVDNALLKIKHEGRWDEIVEREAVRLGVRYQISGKWCSFVAVDSQSNKEHESLIFSESRTATLVRNLERPVARPYVPHARPYPIIAASRWSDRSQDWVQQSRRPAFSSRTSTASMHDNMANPELYRDMQHPAVYRDSQSPERRVTRARSASSNGSRGASFSKALKKKTISGEHNKVDMMETARPRVWNNLVNSEEGQLPLRSTLTTDVTHSLPQVSSVPPSLSNEEKMDVLIRLQNSDGSWNWSEALGEILGPFDNLPGAQKNDAFATNMAIEFFKTELAGEKETWELIVQKAELWLAQHGNSFDPDMSDS